VCQLTEISETWHPSLESRYP